VSSGAAGVYHDGPPATEHLLDNLHAANGEFDNLIASRVENISKTPRNIQTHAVIAQEIVT
jgi:hypothetical protein